MTRWARAIQVRPGEGRTVLLVATLFACLEAGRYKTHVGARFPKGSFVKDKHSGSVDHIAFKASGAVDFRKRLKKLHIEFEEQNIENAGYQVFLYDPVGTKLEFNFLNEHVEDAVALGTTADANMR